MKILLPLALAGSAISLALATFAQQKDTVDPKIIEPIRLLAAKHDTAFNKNDPTAIATLYTEDGVHGFHGTIHGREAIAKNGMHTSSGVGIPTSDSLRSVE